MEQQTARLLEDGAILQSGPGRKLDLYHSKGFQDPEFMTDQDPGELAQTGTSRDFWKRDRENSQANIGQLLANALLPLL